MIGVNPSASLKAGLQVRPAVAADLQKISDLLFFESRIHRHLDWRTPLEWVGRSPFWLLEEQRRVVAALACPPDPDSISWIRLFALASHLSGPQTWSVLWDATRRQLAEGRPMVVAAIVTQRWFESILAQNGFAVPQQIVLLEWTGGPPARSRLSADIVIRRMTPADLPGVVAVDAEAFQPLWHNSLEALSRAYSQSLYASVAEDASGLAGYQLSTKSPPGAHLARLAVRPQAQGRGIGSALVRDLLVGIGAGGSTRITVNTQKDNPASLALYRKLGFHLTGEEYPVYTHRVE